MSNLRFLKFLVRLRKFKSSILNMTKIDWLILSFDIFLKAFIIYFVFRFGFEVGFEYARQLAL